MPEAVVAEQPETQVAEAEQGCAVAMYEGRRCGRPIYAAPSGVDKEPVCLMHSPDPDKDNQAFQEEFERILREAGEGVADFSKFVFPTANYRSREFNVACIFSGAKFTRDAYFSGARFAQDADFRFAMFTRDADFSEVTFTQDANFTRAAFTRGASFVWATFGQDVYFARATFTQRADFRRATFERNAEFRETRFREDASPEPGPVFVEAHFERPELVTFYMTYLGQALFHNCDISKCVFSVVRWRQRPNGKRMVLEDAENLDITRGITRAVWPEADDPDERNYGLIAELYQQLKKKYDDRKDYWTAGDFHYGEMEMKRLACPRLTWLSSLQEKLSSRRRLKRLGDWCGGLRSRPWLLRKVRWLHQRFGLAAWYRRASDYGESWGKPVFWLLAVLLFFAATYPLLGLRQVATDVAPVRAEPAQAQTGSAQARGLKYWNCERPGRLFWHSAMTSLSIAAFQRDLAYEPVYPWGKLLVIVEILLTSTLLALFLLAVRRQFRR